MTKIGDRLSVQIDSVDVAEAYVENVENGLATIVIPATRLVVELKQSLDLSATRTPETDRVFVGVEDSQPNTSEAAEAVNQPVQPPAQPSDVGEGIHNMQLDSSLID